jgi:hypothetical protein
MADNSTLPVSSGTEVFANKDVGGVKFPKAILHDSAGAEILGTKTDPKSALTDATPATAISVLKQISFSMQAVAAGVVALGPNVTGNSMPVTLASDPDTRTATTNIGVSDAGSSSTTGQNSAAVITGTANAGSFASWAVNGSALTRIQLSGTWVATLAIEGSCDGGTTWGLKTAHISGTAFAGSSLTGNGQFDVDSAGLTNVRVRCTAFTSGTAIAQANITNSTGAVEVLNPIRIVDGTSGASLTIKPASTAAVATDPSAVMQINPMQPTLAIALDTSQLANGSSATFLTPAWVKINIASATTTTVVPLVAAKKIRILACYLVDGGANNVNWQSHATTSNGDAPLNLSAGSGLVLPFNPCGWFETTAGEALDIVTSTSAQLSGRIQYVAV